MQTLEIISVNIWHIVVSLLNLLLLFLIVKKFLFKPVKKVLDSRKEHIDTQYSEAEKALNNAKASERELNEKLSAAHKTADDILKEATAQAENRRENIVKEAENEASIIIRQAKASAELEKKKAEDEIKEQIVDVSSALTEKLIEREINTEDHRKLIDSFISEMGELSDAE
ncbi:MAG: F0F1 ATP synthase subunit B [Clostridia bacterium]|nr:F0F1 ATP synthase subunit B [Clostridia bacterium]MBQ8566415.1 F0F1 ATP synthase subunit B [Clostridia bacterium]